MSLLAHLGGVGGGCTWQPPLVLKSAFSLGLESQEKRQLLAAHVVHSLAVAWLHRGLLSCFLVSFFAVLQNGFCRRCLKRAAARIYHGKDLWLQLPAALRCDLGGEACLLRCPEIFRDVCLDELDWGVFLSNYASVAAELKQLSSILKALQEQSAVGARKRRAAARPSLQWLADHRSGARVRAHSRAKRWPGHSRRSREGILGTLAAQAGRYFDYFSDACVARRKHPS